ncbi:2'-5'-oligoadenylate synthase 1A isoform X2 [Cricetulus griseus]|uniref:2'-5' oligoadenylate synthase n=1 Tax=Cricetulus griseus TaxID=10029 RepID=A0A9J7GUM5_CRIGR|nr:2'-5'-oligoadenylate synthase 1A isoform X2 [Cricetulus griseus]XP_035299172.1 2'-5'-oligoadenylate synthase 1A isoform X2 [Cricetulus griseus]
MEQGLSRTRARDLDKFIEVHLLPNTSFRTEVKAAIKIICDFLKERCFRGATHPVRVSKVVKGGSSGKGTALKGRSDADLVVFLNNLHSFEDQLERRGEFIEEIRKQLCNFQRELHIWVKIEVQSSWWPNPRALSFKLSSFQHQQEVEFDVLPAYDVLGQLNYIKPHPQIYADLIRECTSLGKEGEFSTCFTELQRNFLKSRPTKLKSLIRLVKHWYQLCKEKLGKPLPQQYALELLTVYAWERGSGVTEFNTAQGFRTVLELVVEYRQLRIYWTEYYDFQHEDVSKYLLRQLRKDRPVILDPADPTGNVAGSNSVGWQRLAEEALAWLQYPCFKSWDGSRVPPWDVPVDENWTCILL